MARNAAWVACSVVLVESHPLAARYVSGLLRRDGITAVLEREPSVRRLQEARRPLVFLIHGESLAARSDAYLLSLRVGFPDSRILIYGRKLVDDELCHMLMLGIHGYLSYDEVEAALADAVGMLAQGRLWFPRKALERLAQLASGWRDARRRGQRLFTGHEEMILGLLERRLSDKEISVALRITERTVRSHLQNIFAKLGVHDRYSATDLAKSRRASGSLGVQGLTRLPGS